MPASPRLLTCPPVDNLRAFDRGDLEESSLVELAEHVGGCTHCQAKLAEVARESGSDPLLRDLRRLIAQEETAQDDPQLTAKRTDPEVTGGYVPESPQQTQVSPGPPSAPITHTFPSQTVVTEATPEEFGDYQLLGKLGEGGMGVVHKAFDTRLKRTVALKMIRTGRATDEERRRFMAEAEAIARLEHPNIVRIYEIGEVTGQPFAALEFVSGGSLDTRIKDTLPNPRSAARLMIPICRAIQAAHEQWLIHRDLKPANILLTGDGKTPLEECVPKVTDFGLAKFLDSTDSSGTRQNAVMGTPSYMAPEQAAGQTADIGPLADIHSLGAMFYDLLTGRPPFKGTTVRETLKLVIEQDPVPPRQLQPGVPRDLETICLKCLRKQPERRYQSAGALADDLQRCLNGEPITARPVGYVEKAWRWCRRKPTLASLIGGSITAAIALFVGAFWFIYAVGDEKRQKEVAQQIASRERAERDASESLEKINRYFALVTQARERTTTRATGWTWKATDDLRAAAGIDTPSRNPTELRTALAAILGGTDVRESRAILPGFHSRVLCYHPNGRWLILAEGRIGALATIRSLPLGVAIVDIQTGETVKKLSYPATTRADVSFVDKPQTIAVSPDGRWLVVGAKGGSVHRWDLQEKNPQVTTWRPEPGGIGNSPECLTVAFSHDNAALYVASALKEEGTITRWDTTTWKQAARLVTRKSAGGLIVSSRGPVYCYKDGPITELDPGTLEIKHQFAPGTVGNYALTADGFLFASCQARNLVLFDADRRLWAFTIRRPYRESAMEVEVDHLRFSPDGRLLAGCSEHSQTLYLWDVTTGEEVARLRLPEGFLYPAFDPSSRFLAISGREKTTILEIAGQREHRIISPHRYPVRSAGLSPNGQLLGVTVAHDPSGRGKAIPALWDLENDRKSPVWQHDWFGLGGVEGSISFSRDDSLLAIVCQDELKVFDRRKGNVRFQLLREDLFVAAFDSRNRLWMAGDKYVWAVPPSLDEKQVLTWANPLGGITKLESLTSLAAGDDWVVVGGLDGSLRLFSTAVKPNAADIRPEKLIAIADRVKLGAVALSPKDALAVVGTSSGKCSLVAIPDGTILTTWNAHTDMVTATVFIDTTTFATAGNDHAVRFWSWDGKEVRELWAFRAGSSVTSLGTFPDGQRLVITCQDERGAHVWDLFALKRRFSEFGIGIEGPRSDAEPRPKPK